MGLSTAGHAAMLTGLTAVAVYASLHTADPGSAGTSEVTGGSPPYARKPITWGIPTDFVDSSNTPTFDVPAGTSPTYFGLWSAVSGGTFYGSGSTASTETFATQGKFVLDNANTLLT